MKTIALIPMRGGSKSIPQKNVAPIAGKPLCYWTIKAAVQSNIFDKIYISTDAQYIIEVVENIFPIEISEKKIIVEKRPLELAQDTTSTEAVILDFVKDKTFEIFCLIQATSPLLSAQDLQEGFHKIKNNSYDSVLSTCRIKRFFWSEHGEPMNYDYQNRPRRQDFKGQLVENGAFYFTHKKNILEFQNRLSGKIGIVEMHEDSFFEIDEPLDFQIVEMLLKKNLAPKQPMIEAIVIDVDGTLTDAGMYYGESGEVLKKFNTQDAQGLAIAREKGVKIFILTAEDSPSVHARLKKIKVDFYEYGIKNKLEVITTWSAENSVNLANVLYIGDDLGDQKAMLACGHRACPQNAVPTIKRISDFISPMRGGEGAVRDIIHHFLNIE